MGDSVTSFINWNNNINYNSTIGNNYVFYGELNYELDDVNNTYWKKLINDLNLNLCVNNSWSGSRVVAPDSELSSASLSRAHNLHNDNTNIYPDIIIIYMGINDLFTETPLGKFSSIDEIYDKETSTYIGDLSLFSHSYATMLHKIVTKYENADVYCCTIHNSYRPNLYEYNETIKQVANYFNLKIIDFYNETNINPSTLSYYTYDYVHPNELGMEELYKCVKNNLMKYYTK